MQKCRSERWKNRQKHSRLFLLIYLAVCALIFILAWKITGYTSGKNSERRYEAELLSSAEVPDTENASKNPDPENSADTDPDFHGWWY